MNKYKIKKIKNKTKQNQAPVNAKARAGHCGGLLRAKKSLGQNFLKSKGILNKIIKIGEIKKEDIILEIGPGKGSLTEKLLENSNCIIAVEKDKDLIKYLKEKFKKEIKGGMLILIEEDILNFNIENILTNKEKANYKIIANIPYNITGAILKKFLTEKNQPNTMILMLQYEVAKRIVGEIKKKNKKEFTKESLLSISVKAYGKPKYIAKINKRYFSPMPKVDSAIIKIDNISRDFFIKNKINEEIFWEVVKKGFSSKRKKIKNNLKDINKEKWEDLKDKRAEDLTLSDWKELV